MGSPDLHPWLAEFVRRLHGDELDARGTQRRTAFRRTREALGAAVALGVPAPALADCLGVTVGSVRNRAATGGSALSPAEIFRLTGYRPSELDEFARLPLPATRAGYDIRQVVATLSSIDTPYRLPD